MRRHLTGRPERYTFLVMNSSGEPRSQTTQPHQCHHALSARAAYSFRIPAKTRRLWIDSWRILREEAEQVYLHSSRFDKFFRMNCALDWTCNRTIEYSVSVLHLPWNKELPELGMRWSFSYGLVHNDESITLSATLRTAGVVVGDVLRMNISGTYEDLYEKVLSSMWDGSKMYEMGGALRMEAALKQRIRDRGTLTQQRLREISDSCFKGVPSVPPAV